MFWGESSRKRVHVFDGFDEPIKSASLKRMGFQRFDFIINPHTVRNLILLHWIEREKKEKIPKKLPAKKKKKKKKKNV
jgi:hypothetical protein